MPHHIRREILPFTAIVGQEKMKKALILNAILILVGAMNPEEGELRPQLLDRFGLQANVESIDDAEKRVEIVELVGVLKETRKSPGKDSRENKKS